LLTFAGLSLLPFAGLPLLTFTRLSLLTFAGLSLLPFTGFLSFAGLPLLSFAGLPLLSLGLRELFTRRLARLLRDLIVQLLQAMTCIGELLCLAPGLVPQGLTCLLDGPIHRLGITRTTRRLGLRKVLRSLRCMRLQDRLGLRERLADFAARDTLTRIRSVHGLEGPVHARERIRELLCGLLRTPRIIRGCALCSLCRGLGLLLTRRLFTRCFCPRALLLGHRQRFELGCLRLRLKLRVLHGIGIRLRSRLLPRFTRSLRFFPGITKAIGRKRRRLAIDGLHRRNLRTRSLTRCGIAFIRSCLRCCNAKRALQTRGGFFKGLCTCMRRRCTRSIELMLKPVDLGIDALLGVLLQRATKRLGLVRNLFRTARLGLFAQRVLGHARERGPGVRKWQRARDGEDTCAHPTR
jgi:hypothetical protein